MQDWHLKVKDKNFIPKHESFTFCKLSKLFRHIGPGRYKRSPPTVYPYVIESIQCLTADLPYAGMSSGILGVKALAGGEFYVRACGPKGCCDSGHLNNEEDNWQRAKVYCY